jgi:hypothetical protein
MSDEINFIDLAALMKIGPDTTAEKFGSLINSSYFDGANLLGVLYQKRLVSLSTSFPGPNPVTVTDNGKALISEAESRSKEEFDHLDMALLTQLANGKRSLTDLSGVVNVRPKDLAMHLYKMIKNNYASYDFRSGTVDLMLTEKGFQQVRTGMPQKASATAGTAPVTSTMPEGMLPSPPQQNTGMIGAAEHPEKAGAAAGSAQGQAQQPMSAQEVEAQVKAKKMRSKLAVLGIIVIVIIVAAVLFYMKVL